MALTFSYDPSSLSNFHYILLTSFDSLFYFISNGSIKMNLLSQLSLILLIPLSIFAASKRIFNQDSAKVIISVLSFTILNAIWGSGINFINYIYATNLNSGVSPFTIRNILNFYTQNSFIHSLIGLWAIPNFLNFIAIFTIFAILFNKSLRTYQILAILTVISTFMFLTHIAEGVIISCLFGSFYIFKRDQHLRKAIISCLIGNMISIMIYYVLYKSRFFTSFTSPESILLALVITSIFLIFSLLIRTLLNKIPIFNPSLKTEEKIIMYVSLVSLIGLIFLTIVRIIHFYFIDYSTLIIRAATGEVFWYNYSLLGIKLFLSLFGIYKIYRNRQGRIKPIFVYTIFFSIIFGKLLTFVNSNFYTTQNQENRIIVFICIAITFILPPVLEEIKKKIDNLNNSKIRSGIKISFLFILINSSFLFVPLVIDTRYKYANSRYSLTEEEWDGIEVLENLYRSDPNISVFCVTERGQDYLCYAGFPNSIAHPQTPRNKTYQAFEDYCEIYLDSEKIYVLFLRMSDDVYFQTLSDELQNYLLDSPRYYATEGVLIIGPLTFN